MDNGQRYLLAQRIPSDETLPCKCLDCFTKALRQRGDVHCRFYSRSKVIRETSYWSQLHNIPKGCQMILSRVYMKPVPASRAYWGSIKLEALMEFKTDEYGIVYLSRACISE